MQFTTVNTSRYVQRILAGQQTGAVSTGPTTAEAVEMRRDLLLEVGKLRTELRALRRATPTSLSARVQAQPAFAASQNSIMLNTDASWTRLESTEQINTDPTSFGPKTPDWDGSSTASISVGGEYSGTGDDVLTFNVVQSFAADQPAVIEVRRENYALTDVIQVEDPDVAYTLHNGLEITFGAGTIEEGDSFVVSANTSTGENANPDGSFNLTGEDGPQFDPGYSVTNGSFRVNGALVPVEANDTIQMVLDRVNALDNGFTGAYDPASDTIIFNQDDPDVAGDLVLSNDTSGLLAAVKIEGAETVHNTVDERDVPMNKVDALGGIFSGNLFINGTEITIDTSTDSLNDVINRINGSGAGVQASFDVSVGKLTLRSGGDQPMELVEGTSQFLTAMGVAAGTYEGTAVQEGSTRRTKAIADHMVSVDKLMTSVLRKIDKIGTGTTTGYKTNLVKALDGLVKGDGTVQRTSFGVRLDTKATDGNLLDFNTKLLRKRLRKKPREVLNFLLGDVANGKKGFIGELDANLKAIEDSLGRQIEAASSYLNTYI